MVLLKRLCIILTLTSFICCYKPSFVQVLNDFLDVGFGPTKIYGYICWKKGMERYLLDTLNGYSISLRKTNGVIQVTQPLNHQLYLLDSNCDGFEKILKQGQELMAFAAPFRWIFIGNREKLLNDLNIFLDSNFYLFSETSDDSYNITSIYKLSKDHNDFIVNDIAFWNQNFSYYNRLIVAKNRTNLHRVQINGTYTVGHKDSMKRLWEYRDMHLDSSTKINYILSYYVLELMNATRNFKLTDTWGYKNRTTGLFSGMIGEIQYRRAEIAAASTFITHDRLDVVEYISPTPTKAAFIFRKPPLSYVTNVLTLPFSKAVWYASFLLVILMCIVTYVIAKWEWSDDEFVKLIEDKPFVLRDDFMDHVVFALGAICQQGSEVEPRSVAGRIAMLFSFVAFLFFFTSYSANIVALLQSTSDSINTVEDLLYSRIKLGGDTVPYTKHYFEEEAGLDKIRHGIYHQKIAPKGVAPHYMDIEVGIRRMREEFFAFHVEVSTGYKLISETFQENEKCGIKVIQIWQVPPPWVAIAKNTTYKELLKFWFRKLTETGVKHREYLKIYVRKPECQGTGSNFMSVGLIDSYYAFLIFGLGTLVSLILLGLEYFLHRKIKTFTMPFVTKKISVSHSCQSESEYEK